MTTGVSAAGFYPLLVSDLITSIEADLGTLVYDPTSPEGQIVGSVSAKLGELWSSLAVAFNNLDRDQATGSALDMLGAITGTVRQTPKPSYVWANCTFSAAGLYPANSLISFVPATPDQQWYNSTDITVTTAGTQSVLFVSAEDGPVMAYASTLTGMVPVSGWTSVTNPLDAKPGVLLEEDPDYRARQVEETAATGASTLASLKADLLTVPGVLSVVPLENVTLVTDPVTGLPPKSFCAVVFDGVSPAASNDAIGAFIWDSKPAGMQSYGTTSVTVQDSRGVDHVVQFSRPTVRPVYVSVTVVLAEGASLGTVGPLVQQAIAALTSGPGVGLVQLRLMAAALSVADVEDVTALALDFIPSPTATANLSATAFQVLALDTSRITVTT